MLKPILLALTLNLAPFSLTQAEAAPLLIGSGDAPVQLVIFGDIQCPFTKKIMDYVDRFEADFGTRIGVQFAHFPLAFHEQAKPAAIAAQCAADQGEFRAFLREAFSHQQSLGREFFLATAQKIGIRDGRTFESCLDSPEARTAVEKQMLEGEALGVNGTPNTQLSGELIQGVYPYEEFQSRIEKALRQGSK